MATTAAVPTAGGGGPGWTGTTNGTPARAKLSGSFMTMAKWPWRPPPRVEGTERALVNSWHCNNCSVVFVGLPSIGVNVSYGNMKEVETVVVPRRGLNQT